MLPSPASGRGAGGEGSEGGGRLPDNAKALRSQGYTVLRFWNNDVMQQLEGVLEQIRRTVTLSPGPSPTRGRGE